MKLLEPVGELLYWWGNRRSARSTIRLLELNGITPHMLIDAGCHNSEWARYLAKRWPTMEIVSFDPCPGIRPIGRLWPIALGSYNATVPLAVTGKQTHVTHTSSHTTTVMRFDCLAIQIAQPAILKVDCECSTSDALIGFGDTLNRFDAVHVEMMNTVNDPLFLNRQTRIMQLLMDYGFDRCECVDASVWLNDVHNWDALFLRNK